MSLAIELLEKSFDQVKPQANDFVTSFYENLFTMYPEAKPLFTTTDMEKQRAKLLGSLVLVVENLRKPEALESALKGLGARHVKYGALPEHYPLVGNALLETFAQYLKSDWTPEVQQAWIDAYGAITNLMLEGADYSQEDVQLSNPSVALEEETEIDLLEKSFGQVVPQADEFAERFYSNLFSMYPEAKPLFAHTNMAEQSKKLLNSLVFVVQNLRNPGALEGALKGLGARHVKYGALPEHYPLVGNALLTTFEQFLGLEWTPKVKQAWVNAYNDITKVMLSGADYPEDIVKLESASSTASSGGSVSAVEMMPSHTVEAPVNWALFGGALGGAGLLALLLLLIV
ncbi:MAG: globin family protein [Microcoleaceae cyanobacterium]